jgi:hypothetical protein
LNKSVLAALQLFKHGLTPLPLIGKKPIIKNWSTRFIYQPLTEKDIVNGISVGNRLIRYNNKNLGILTGKISNVIVLDLDNIELLKKLRMYGDLPTTWLVKSSRGFHFYYKYQDDIPSLRLWNGIDILSDKKIVVAPPSIHPSGKTYEWIYSPKDVEIAELPTWIKEIIVKQKICSNTLYTSSAGKKSYRNKGIFTEIDWYEFFSRHLKNIKGTGSWLSAKCPFHDDRHNSFSFNTVDGGWICFAGCGKGNGIQFIQRIYDISFTEARLLLKGRDIYVKKENRRS